MRFIVKRAQGKTPQKRVTANSSTAEVTYNVNDKSVDNKIVIVTDDETNKESDATASGKQPSTRKSKRVVSEKISDVK